MLAVVVGVAEVEIGRVALPVWLEQLGLDYFVVAGDSPSSHSFDGQASPGKLLSPVAARE